MKIQVPGPSGCSRRRQASPAHDRIHAASRGPVLCPFHGTVAAAAGGAPTPRVPALAAQSALFHVWTYRPPARARRSRLRATPLVRSCRRRSRFDAPSPATPPAAPPGNMGEAAAKAAVEADGCRDVRRSVGPWTRRRSGRRARCASQATKCSSASARRAGGIFKLIEWGLALGTACSPAASPASSGWWPGLSRRGEDRLLGVGIDRRVGAVGRQIMPLPWLAMTLARSARSPASRASAGSAARAPPSGDIDEIAAGGAIQRIGNSRDSPAWGRGHAWPCARHALVGRRVVGQRLDSRRRIARADGNRSEGVEKVELATTL